MLGESSLPTNSTEPLPRNISTLKRPASLSLELHEDDTRKRIKAQADHNPESWTALDSNEMVAISTNEGADILAKELAQELQCACCSELVYRPVVVSPCQHFFCGRYVPHSLRLICDRSLRAVLAVAFFGSR